MGIHPNDICTIRNTLIQAIHLGVPEIHLGGHAYYTITINSGGMEIEINTRVNGRKAYIPGLEAILARICELGGNVYPGIQQAEDFIFG